MFNKAKRRKQEEGKETIFLVGGRSWDRNRIENTLSRSKMVDKTELPLGKSGPQKVSL